MKDEGEEISLRTPKVADRRHIIYRGVRRRRDCSESEDTLEFADNIEEVLEPCGPWTSSIASPGHLLEM